VVFVLVEAGVVFVTAAPLAAVLLALVEGCVELPLLFRLFSWLPLLPVVTAVAPITVGLFAAVLLLLISLASDLLLFVPVAPVDPDPTAPVLSPVSEPVFASFDFVLPGVISEFILPDLLPVEPLELFPPR